MAESNYLDFDLWVHSTEEGYRVKGWDPHGREATVGFEKPWNDLEIENFRLRIARPRRTLRRTQAPEQEAVKAFGGQLFERVFQGELLSCFRASLEEARSQDMGLRVRLRLEQVPELADLPWEYLYDRGLNRFFALSVHTPVVRYMELRERIRPLEMEGPLRVLAMLSSPEDFEPLDVAGEWTRLGEALGPFEERGLIKLRKLEAATMQELQRELRRSAYHIFHFVGHGGFQESTGEGLLVFEDDDGKGTLVASEHLGVLLHDHKSLRLAVLNACEGARTSHSDPFSGVAQTLVQAGIPAVVAMQAEISDEAALTLAHELYRALADGYPVDLCLAEARKAVSVSGNVEWGTPVLYSRAPDGRVFEIPERPEEGSETPSESLMTTGLVSVRAVLVTELVDRERLWHSLDDRQAARVLKQHDRLARDLLDRFEGREVEKGKTLVYLFARAADAVGYALAYHEGLEELSKEVDRHLAARAGIHFGEIVIRENPPDDVARGAPPVEAQGRAKLVATQVMSLARSGQTLLSQVAFDMAKHGTGDQLAEQAIRWGPHGSHRLREGDEPVPIFEVGLAGSVEDRETDEPEPAAGKPRGVDRVSASRRPRLLAVAAVPAVLILAAAALLWLVSRGPGAVAVVDAMDGSSWRSLAVAEVLGYALAAGGEVRTIGPSRTVDVDRDFAAAPEMVELERLATLFDAALVVECVDRGQAGGGLAIGLLLRDPADGAIRWRRILEGPNQNVLDLALEAAAALRQELGAAKLTAEQEAAVRSALPASFAALRLYVRGIIAYRQGEVLEARRQLEGAAGLDPAPFVHAALAGVLAELGIFLDAAAAADRALESARGLSSETRLELERRLLGAQDDWQRQAETYRLLFERFPDDLDFGVRWAEARIEAGEPEPALELLAGLRERSDTEIHRGHVDLASVQAHLDLGNLDEAVAAANRAVAAGEQSGALLLQARALLQGARALRLQASLAEARTYLERARTLFERTGHLEGLRSTFQVIANVVRMERPGAVRERLETYRETYRQNGDWKMESLVSLTLTNALISEGELAQAVAILGETRAELEKHGATYLAAQAAVNLGAALQNAGALERARTLYEKALDDLRSLGDPLNEALVMTNLGEVLFFQGDLDRAWELHAAALEINRERDPVGAAYDTFRLAEVAAVQGNFDKAAELYQKALDLQGEVGHRLGQAETRLGRARLELERDNFSESLSLARQAEDVFWELGESDLAVLAQIARLRTMLARPRGQLPEARALFEKIRAHALESENHRVTLGAALAEARLRVREGADAAALDEALERLGALLEAAVEQGNLQHAFALRLGTAEIELARAQESAGRSRLLSLRDEARQRGLELWVRRAEAHLTP